VRAFLVRLPSSVRYWTVVDDGYRVVSVADEYLQHLRLGRDAAESTTKSYAEALALYLRWCEQGSRDWRTAAERLGGFITWLRHTPGDPDAPLAGRGVADVRGAGRINRVLSAVRGFLRHGVVTGEVPAGVLAMLYDITDDRHLPVEVRGEAAGLQYAARPCHRLSETETEIDRASDAEVLGLLRACRSARDRFIVTAMARAGLRSGEVTGLRREDMHLVADATSLGCLFPGAHLHVRRRDNPNGAWAKSRRSRPVPLTSCWSWPMTRTGSSGTGAGPTAGSSPQMPPKSHASARCTSCQPATTTGAAGPTTAPSTPRRTRSRATMRKKTYAARTEATTSRRR
jgi:integrase/recombinase XerD